MAQQVRKSRVKEVPLSEMKDDLSRFLREAGRVLVDFTVEVPQRASEESMERATRDSWKREPLPTARAPLPYSRTLNAVEAARVMNGLIPEVMEDKWFVLCDEGWLLFYRSWTGFCTYGLKLTTMPDGLLLSEGWVSRDTEQFQGTDLDWDRKCIDHIIDWIVAGQFS